MAKSLTASASFMPINRVSMFSFMAPSCNRAAKVRAAWCMASTSVTDSMARFSASNSGVSIILG